MALPSSSPQSSERNVISDTSRSEQLLRREHAELSQLIDTSIFGLHWVDANGKILWANTAAAELLGYSVEEFLGLPLTRLFEHEERARTLLRMFESHQPARNFEARLRCKDGTVKIVLLDATPKFEDGKLLHFNCFTRDITDQRRAEVASRLLGAIVASSDDAIISKSLDGIITSWNAAASRIFGYTEAEIVGRPILWLIPADRLDEETEILARLRRGERVDHFETLRRRKDGSLIDISVTISPIYAADGTILGASKIARDITDRKRAEKMLEAARRELQQTNEQLEQRVADRTASLREAVAQMEEFSYTVSHDLRAPLRGMQVYSQLLLEEYGNTLNDEARHCLNRISDNANRLDKMVTDVLLFSRITRAEIKLERVHLDKLARDIVATYPALQGGAAVVEISTLHDVIGHEPSLTQIISNLLSNAVKFVAKDVSPKVRVWSDREGDFVKFWVQDNGIGIKPERQDRLFRMFERVHPDLPYEGTGVGLAIVRKAAIRMGGDVGVVSDGEHGAAFWAQLRAAV